jgi:hypothetical protein
LQELARGEHTTVVKNNQIYDYANSGIEMLVGGSSTSVTGVPHDGDLNATIQGNTIAEPTAPTGGLAQNGIHLNGRTNSTGGNDAYDICVDIGGAGTNATTMNGSGALGGTDFRLRQRFATTVRMPGYTGANNVEADVVNFVKNRNNNPLTTTGSATFSVPTGGGFQNTNPAGASCAQP